MYVRNSFLLWFFTLLHLTLLGQVDLTKRYEPKFSFEIESQKKDGKLRPTTASYFYTFIGEYEKALESYELPLNWGLESISRKDSVRFSKFSPVDAFEFLKESIKNKQIVIISEAHHKPQHRIFTTLLLKELSDNGFKYIGLETLGRDRSGVDSNFFLLDTLLNKRGYPLYMPITGTYTLDPQMGNLVRTAHDLGMELFAYERTSGDRDRDLQQALNIQAFLREHPGEKIVIHCGWYHAIESSFLKGREDHWMAYHLKRLTGIDPLTIYQDALSEKKLEKESPYYQMLESKKISVLVDEKNNVFSGVDTLDHFDILIYHPRTTYIKGRPDWLMKVEGNKLVKFKKKKLKEDQEFPMLIKAIPDAESKDATPVDIVELIDKEEDVYLALKKGRYKIWIADKNGNETYYKIKVK